MKKTSILMAGIAGFLLIACNRIKVDTVCDIDIAWTGNYSIRDMQVVAENQGPIGSGDLKSAGHKNIYLCGIFRGEDDKNRCLTAKYTDKGKLLWFRLYPDMDTSGNSLSIVGRSISASWGGGMKQEHVYVLAEESYDQGHRQLVLLRYDSLGNIQGEMTVVRSTGELKGSLFTDNAGNLYCAGDARESSGGVVFFMNKYGPSGDLVWSRLYPRSDVNCRHVEFRLRYPGRLICAGILENIHKPFYMTFDTLGKAMDMVVCESPRLSDALASVMVDERGTVYLASNCFDAEGSAGFSSCAYDVSNNMLWHSDFDDNSGGKYQARALAIDDSGFTYVAGCKNGGPGSEFLVLVCYDTAGAEVWRRTDVTFPGKTIGPWFIRPERIHNNFKYRSAPDIDIIGGTGEAVFIIRYNTAGSQKAVVWHRVKGQVATVEREWIVFNFQADGYVRCRLLKYEDFEILGINRWD